MKQTLLATALAALVLLPGAALAQQVVRIAYVTAENSPQASQARLFAEQVEAMYSRGVRTFVEVGPGSVLTNLVGRCLGDRPHTALATDRKGGDGVTALWSALGRLAVAGVRLDLERLWDGYRLPEDPADRPKAKLSLAIRGSNYDTLYPPDGGSAALPAPNPPREPEVREVVREVIRERI